MKARNFRYIRPASLDHAYRILAENEGDAVPIAGGQSLLAGLNMRLSAPKLLVDIGDLKELVGEFAGRRNRTSRSVDAASRAAWFRACEEACAPAGTRRVAYRARSDP